MANHGSAKEMCSAPHPLELMQAAVRTLLVGIGEDVNREGLLDTPKRVAKALLDASHGYHQTPSGVLGSAYFHEPIVNNGGEGLVLVRDIDFASTSEETLLPFHGRCHIGYVPQNGVVLGLSKLARLTRLFAKRLQTQERLGREVAVALQRQLQCQGVAVVIQAKHLTMEGSAPTQPMTTACLSGCFTDSTSSAFQEMLCMVGVDCIPAGSLLQLPGPCTDLAPVRRSISGLSDSSSGCATSVVSTNAQGPPLPPSTPDLSDHLSESDSIQGAPACGGCGGSCGSKCGMSAKMSENGSEKDLTDLVSGNSDRDLSEQDSDSEPTPHLTNQLQEAHFLPPAPQRLRMSASHPLYADTDEEHASSPAPQQPFDGSRHTTQGVHVDCSPSTPTAMLSSAELMLPSSSHPSASRATDPRWNVSVDAMEQAAQRLITAMGECSHRPGLLGSARRYVMTLLSATSGYLCQLPAPLYTSQYSHSNTTTTNNNTHSNTTVPALGSSRHSAGTCPCCSRNRASQHGVNMQLHRQGLVAQPDESGGPGSSFRHVKISFTSQCEHHMLPFYGHAHVVYNVPSDAQPYHQPDNSSGEEAAVATVPVLDGANTKTRRDLNMEQHVIQQVVRLFTQRLQVQERITHQVADGVATVLGASHVLVLVDAAHMCMVARGVENHAGHTTSIAVRGDAVGDAAWRARALLACRASGLA